MEIQKGKYYKGSVTGVIVKALSSNRISGYGGTGSETFKATVVEIGNSTYSIGETCNYWDASSFDEILYIEKSNELFPIY